MSSARLNRPRRHCLSCSCLPTRLLREPWPRRLGLHSPAPRQRQIDQASGGDRETTNNRMELSAVIAGLAALTKPSEVEVVIDSEYVAKGCREWLPGWKRNGWKRREGKKLKPLANENLWRQLDEVASAPRAIYGRAGTCRPPRKRTLRRIGRGCVAEVSSIATPAAR